MRHTYSQSGLSDCLDTVCGAVSLRIKSRGLEDTPEKKKRFEGEVKRFQDRWKAELAAGDPYYNPNLSLDREDFSLR